MSHRVHPKAYRLRDANDWDSRWQTKKNLAEFLEEDFVIRSFLEKQLKDCGLQSVEIEKSPDKINIIINTSRPGLIIGRGGKGVEELREKIEQKISKISRRKETLSLKKIKNKEKAKKEISVSDTKQTKKVKIDIKEIREPWTKSSLVAQLVASQLEKRFPYRRALKQGLDKIMNSKGIKGARIQVAGRLDGKEIARKEWLKIGSLPRQTLRAEIDYGTASAHCNYGVVGIKVWIYKGEKFD
ncbi:30S ribosomal protein S3 [Candidatus Parcubacteria bacterium]|nr:30S ribosomal protein S3 [Candidatus Parcubacteria bacterium]